MNTSFLSMFPPAPSPEQPQPARPAKSGKAVFEAGQASTEPDVDEAESTGDSDKADAFAEMLAAMISVATPPTETHVETVQPAEISSVTTSATDVPRDGAGSPLFGASFTAATPQVATSVATTTTNGPVDFAATAADAVLVGNADGEGQNGVGVLSDTAASEIAAIGTETTEATSELVDLAGDVELAGAQIDEKGNVETTLDDQANVETALPIVEVHESTTVTSEGPTARANAASDVTSVDRPATSEPVKGPANETVLDSGNSQTSDAAVTKSEVAAPVEAPVTDTRGTVASEAHPVEPQPVTNADTVAPAETVVVDEPSEAPRVAPTEQNERSSAKPAGSRPTRSPIVQDSSANAAPVQPEPTSAVTAVEPASEVGVQKDVSGKRSEAPIESVHQTAEPSEAEALLATGTTNTETSNNGSVASVVSSHTDAGAASTPSHVSQQVLQALAAYEAELPQNGSRSFEMLLDPPELGRLLIQMSRTSKGVDVRISAENENVRSILETSSTEMQQNLQLSGFDLGQFSGSNSGGGFANGEEWVAAPTLQSFASATPAPARPNTTHTTGNSAVNVVV